MFSGVSSAVVWRALMFGGLLIGGVFIVVELVTKPGVLSVKEIRLVGNFTQTSADKLGGIVAQQINGNLITLDLDTIYHKLIKYPWVAQVWVDRIWPDTLQVRVVEQQAIAVWNDEALINRRGEVFVQVRQSFGDALPRLMGPESSAELVMQTYVSFTELLVSFDLAIDWIKLDMRHAWAVQLDNGVELVLGRENTLQRFSQFLRIYRRESIFRKRAIERVDLRYTHGFALRWKQPLSKIKKPSVVV